MWTPSALASEARPVEGGWWRVVEAQHRNATMSLVEDASLDDQALLEAEIESVKPPVPEAARGLPYLLFTPFRYRPGYPGSRFRRADRGPDAADGVFYAAETVATALAETAFHRFLFFSLSAMAGRPSSVPHTAFATDIPATAVDLTRPPLDRDRAFWTDPVAYGPCQDLADAARAAELEAIVYRSVRDPEGRRNIAVLRPEPLARGRRIVALQTWWLHMTAEVVSCVSEFPARGLSFRRAGFADPRLAG
ncbi:MAG: RES family NAD+ phosphorylase [Thalassobaculum sp.]|uniref:RES family NAD+ phosphorylase n=1 Tax=Thalassobaculum sp. TaxID=2022740 RepID=UPI0032ECC43B